MTTDGGQSWHWNGATTKFYLTSDNFADLQHAWSLGTNSDDRLLYATSDGGQNWLKYALSTQFNRYGPVTFVTAQVGWMVAMNIKQGFLPEPGGGLQKGDVSVLLQTTDGGQNWHEVSRAQI